MDRQVDKQSDSLDGRTTCGEINRLTDRTADRTLILLIKTGRRINRAVETQRHCVCVDTCVRDIQYLRDFCLMLISGLINHSHERQQPRPKEKTRKKISVYIQENLW